MIEKIKLEGGLYQGTIDQTKPGRKNLVVSFAQFRPEK